MKNEQELIEKTINLAERWQNKSTTLISDWDKDFSIKMKKMLAHPEDKALLIE